MTREQIALELVKEIAKYDQKNHISRQADPKKYFYKETHENLKYLKD